MNRISAISAALEAITNVIVRNLIQPRYHKSTISRFIVLPATQLNRRNPGHLMGPGFLRILSQPLLSTPHTNRNVRNLNAPAVEKRRLWV